MIKQIFLLSVLLGSFSCSSFKVTRVTDANRNQVKGLRFFIPAPYLLVAEKDLLVDGEKTVKENSEGRTSTIKKMAVARRELHCSVVYLPDPQKEYSISTLSGKTPKSVRLEDGWRLTGVNCPEYPTLTAQQFWLLSGTKGLQPGLYAIHYEEQGPILKKVEIIP